MDEVTEFTALPGNGLTAKQKGEQLFGGNQIWIQKQVTIADTILQKAEMLAKEGKTPLFFARGKELMGVIAVADVVKPTSRQAVQELSGMGIEVVMLTGDNRKTAEAIQRQVGVIVL